MNIELDYQKYPILLIDDDLEVLESFSMFLKDNFTVETASDPEKALEMIKAKKYAVIISDQRMPKMKGSALLAKAHQLSPESIRVLVTAYTDLEAAIEAINKGEIYRYISKRVSGEDKEILIKQAIELYHTKREKERLQKENERMLKKLAVQQKLSAIGYFGFRLNEWLSPILGKIEKFPDGRCFDKGLSKQISRLKFLMQRIEEIYRQTDFDVPGLRNQMEFYDLNEIVTSSVNFSKAFEKRGIRRDWQGIRIITKLDNTLPKLHMAKGSIQVAIEELLINAKQAIEERRIESADYTEGDTIELRTWHEIYQGKTHIYLKVADNGCGILPENIKDIFKPLMSFSKYPVNRSGIGLNIVEQVITYHNGQIHIESTPGQGSKFILEFVC